MNDWKCIFIEIMKIISIIGFKIIQMNLIDTLRSIRIYYNPNNTSNDSNLYENMKDYCEFYSQRFLGTKNVSWIFIPVSKLYADNVIMSLQFMFVDLLQIETQKWVHS